MRAGHGLVDDQGHAALNLAAMGNHHVGQSLNNGVPNPAFESMLAINRLLKAS